MRYYYSIAVSAMSLALLFGCSSSVNSRTNYDEEKTRLMSMNEKKEFNDALNSFAFKIFKEIWNDGPERNILVAPASISYALMMTLNGAEGETASAIKNVLELTGYSTEEINMEVHSLSKSVFDAGSGVNIKLANSVWFMDGLEIDKNFIERLNDYYRAESRQFKGSDPDVPAEINNWIEYKTDGMIRDMIDKIDPSIIMMLINAISFEGLWTYEFDEDNTVDAPFLTSGDRIRQVRMMKRTGDILICEGDGWDMAEIPYGDGRFAIDIILPDKGNGIDGILDAISDRSFNEWISKATTKQTALSLPRFSYGYKVEMKDMLTYMGMGIAFGEEADFTGISKKFPLSIDKVTHQTFIENTEKGTKAAATTIVGIKRISYAPEERFVFNADHPFVYLIRERAGNTIIFLGSVTDPE